MQELANGLGRLVCEELDGDRTSTSYRAALYVPSCWAVGDKRLGQNRRRIANRRFLDLDAVDDHMPVPSTGNAGDLLEHVHASATLANTVLIGRAGWSTSTTKNCVPALSGFRNQHGRH